MKNFTKLLLATSMLSLTTLTFAKELEGSLRADFLGYNNNKINSIGIALPISGASFEVITGKDKNVEGYASAGFNIGLRTDKSGYALISPKIETGARYKINDSVKVGGGLKYSYNFAGMANPNDHFNDLSVTATGRYTTNSNKIFQLEVSKSVTDQEGFGANFSAGQAF